MANDVAEKAVEAFVDDDFELAVDLYTKAINFDSQNADLFADRAQANIKLKNFTEAVADANKAIELDSSMAKAYLRKGTACIKLEEYQAAKAALVTGASLVQNDSRFTKLIKECDDHIAEETGNVTLKPNPSPKAVQTSNGSEASSGTAANLGELGQGNESNQKKEMELVQPKFRHAFYQKQEEVVVTIFAKGIPAKSIAIEFGEQILSVTIDIPGEQANHFQRRLFGKIIPDKCRYEVLSTKIEIRLAKAEAINWVSLEYSQENAVKQVHSSSAVGSGRPTYTSSKRSVADWDKLEAQVKKEEKEEKLDGDAAVNKMFGEIYRNSDEDVRRAMIKSFYESNGTVLSTNWQDVGAKKVEGSPPEGMELKKWEY